MSTPATGRKTKTEAAAGGRSDASRSAEPDRHPPIVVDDDRHGAAAVAERQHAGEIVSVLLHVDVGDGHAAACVVVARGLYVRARVLSEDRDHLAIVE